MNILHDSHPGIVRMKGIARSHVWWPKMDQALEERVKNCSTCQEHRKMPASAPLHPWEWPVVRGPESTLTMQSVHG